MKVLWFSPVEFQADNKIKGSGEWDKYLARINVGRI